MQALECSSRRTALPGSMGLGKSAKVADWSAGHLAADSNCMCRVQMSARELADGRAALQIRLTSLLAWPALLHEAPLAFQPGFCLEADLTAAAGMFPLRVSPVF